MTVIDRLIEEARGTTYGDSWYRQQHPYALEIDGDINTVFVFPLGPESLSISRPFRQSVTPTLGGLSVEERGLLGKDFVVSGSFGLEPKEGYDTSGYFAGEYKFIDVKAKLSGPMWTMRMIRNFFEVYGEMKANPDTAAQTRLIWHDFKTDEHYVIVPLKVDLNRTTQRRMQFPFSLVFKAVGDAEAIVLPPSKANILDVINSVISTISMGIEIVQAAMQETSQFLGEVRYFAATVDQLIDDVTRVVSAATDVIEGGKRVADLGSMFLNSVTALMEETLGLLEEAGSGLPHDVYHEFAEMQAGVHAISAQLAAMSEGPSYGEEADELGTAGAGVNGTSKDAKEKAAAGGPPTTALGLSQQTATGSDQALIDAGAGPEQRQFGAYQGYVIHEVTGADTLRSLAAQYLGDGALWYDIAMANGLKPPYISPTGGPGIARMGDRIAVPTLSPNRKTSVVSAGAGSLVENRLGTDMRLKETNGSRPGRPMVDMQIDKRTYRDAATISGVGNLVQATQLRVWTRRGTMPLLPRYGMAALVGYSNNGANTTAVVVSLRATLRQDSRIQRIGTTKVTAEDDVVEFDTDVIPIGSTDVTTVSLSLT